MIIICNGRERSLPTKYKRLEYDEVVVLTYGPTGPEAIHTVTYFHRKGPSGNLSKGESVKLKTGMVFNCVQTNKA